ncbi:MAG TPA: hypothetical protein VKR21_18435 [Solirubrobacteraceae bacterium]|nr:hypothetical protein [Solirubrobacteraceae bacterium]
MSALFLTYLWHYLAARAVYDSLLRPLIDGHPTELIGVGLVAAAAFLLGRRSATRGGR